VHVGIKREAGGGDAFQKLARGTEETFDQGGIVGKEENVPKKHAQGVGLTNRFDAVLWAFCQKKQLLDRSLGIFADPGEFSTVGAYTPAIRPDGHAVYTEHRRTVAIFLEHDTGSEPLHVLAAKLPRYAALARVTRRDWPVLFWLPSAARERHLQDRLGETPASVRAVPVGTAARDRAAAEGLSPAEAIWWLHAHPGPLLRIVDLPGAWPARTRPITS